MSKRHVQIEAANPTIDLNACLGKVRFATEEEAAERVTARLVPAL
jgi:hypothetical protein